MRNTMPMIELPFSAACERNRGPILAQLQGFFADRRRVLEIGGGTGQHAEYFAEALGHLIWQSSDRQDYLPGLAARVERSALPNLPMPMEFDVMDDNWPAPGYDAVYAANILHIMAWSEVQRLFLRLPEITVPGAKLVIYGPFNIDQQFTSASNAAFDAALRQRAAHMGLRDRAAVDALASGAGFALQDEVEMPANNRMLCWQR